MLREQATCAERVLLPPADLINVFEVFLPQLLLYPNPTDPLNGEAAALLMREPAKYNTRVKGETARQLAGGCSPGPCAQAGSSSRPARQHWDVRAPCRSPCCLSRMCPCGWCWVCAASPAEYVARYANPNRPPSRNPNASEDGSDKMEEDGQQGAEEDDSDDGFLSSSEEEEQ